jgi:hypothetical protein
VVDDGLPYGGGLIDDVFDGNDVSIETPGGDPLRGRVAAREEVDLGAPVFPEVTFA